MESHGIEIKERRWEQAEMMDGERKGQCGWDTMGVISGGEEDGLGSRSQVGARDEQRGGVRTRMKGKRRAETQSD